MKEENLHKQICDYLKIQYPNVIFNTDMSGIKLTQGQANKASKLRSNSGFPDIIIYEQRLHEHYYGALFLEVKIETPFKKDGTLKKMIRYEKVNGVKFAYDHLRRQSELRQRLRDKGYKCEFVWTFDMAKKIIDDYLR